MAIDRARNETLLEWPLSREDGLTTNDSKTKANILNEHFYSVFTTEDSNDLPDSEPSQYPTRPMDIMSQVTYVLDDMS